MEARDSTGFVLLSADETYAVQGGGLITGILKKVSWFWVAQQVIEHWDEIRAGARKGWNYDHQNAL